MPGSLAGDRGQAHTVEAFVSAILLLTALIVAVQSTAVTPLSASTSNQFIEAQHRSVAEGVLSGAVANETLIDALVYWNTSRKGNGAFNMSGDDGYYNNGGPPIPFGNTLNETFRDQHVAFNVYVQFLAEDNTTDSVRMVYQGSPSDNAISFTRTAVLMNGTELSSASGGTVEDAAAADDFYAPDVDQGGPLYNVVEVRLVVWEI